jgi:hypothetical protein
LKAVLSQTGIHVLGCVANKHRYSRDDSAYSYYYYSQTEEQNGSMKQGRNGQVSPLPPTTSHNGGVASRMPQGGVAETSRNAYQGPPYVSDKGGVAETSRNAFQVPGAPLSPMSPPPFSPSTIHRGGAGNSGFQVEQ